VAGENACSNQKLIKRRRSCSDLSDIEKKNIRRRSEEREALAKGLRRIKCTIKYRNAVNGVHARYCVGTSSDERRTGARQHWGTREDNGADVGRCGELGYASSGDAGVSTGNL
jgi:hypothetical protein